MKQKITRKGCKDIWNAFMCEGIDFSQSKYDIPFCPTTAIEIPKEIITWDVAKHIHKKRTRQGDKDYCYNAVVCFYMDDYKFDGPRGIWNNSGSALSVLKHFAGVITPDFSTYQDFPDPIKRYNTYRMRVFGYWLSRNGIYVINNVRWGTRETWVYCWDGIPKESMIAIGTVGGNPRKIEDRKRFEEGFYELVNVLRPHAIIVYGSANYPCFAWARSQGIAIISYMSKTASAFDSRRQSHE